MDIFFEAEGEEADVDLPIVTISCDEAEGPVDEMAEMEVAARVELPEQFEANEAMGDQMQPIILPVDEEVDE